MSRLFINKIIIEYNNFGFVTIFLVCTGKFIYFYPITCLAETANQTEGIRKD